MPSALGVVGSGRFVYSPLVDNPIAWFDSSDMQYVTPDPQAGAHLRLGGLFCPGTSGNYASTTRYSALNISGDMEYVVRVKATSYRPATTQTLISQAQDYWWPTFQLRTGSLLHFNFVDSASFQRNFQIPVPAEMIDNTTYWMKAVLDVNNGTGGSTVYFYYAADQVAEPTSWTLIQASTIGSTSLAHLTGNTTDLGIGSNPMSGGGSYPLSGYVLRAIVRADPLTTPVTVFDADFTQEANYLLSSFRESSSNNVLVTINSTSFPRIASWTPRYERYSDGVKDGKFTINSLSTYATVPDSNALDLPGTVQDIIIRLSMPTWATGAQGVICSNFELGIRGYQVVMDSLGRLGFNYGTGATNWGVYSTALPFVGNQIGWVRIFRNSGTTNFYYANDSVNVPTSWTALGIGLGTSDGSSIAAGTTNLSIGRTPSGVSGFVGSLYRIQLWTGDSTSGGTKRFDADFTGLANGTTLFNESSSNAAPVTISGGSPNASKSTSTSWPILVRRFNSKYLLSFSSAGTSSLDTSTIPLPQTFAVFAVLRSTATGTSIIFEQSADANTNDGFYLSSSTGQTLFVRRAGQTNYRDAHANWVYDLDALNTVMGYSTGSSSALNVYKSNATALVPPTGGGGSTSITGTATAKLYIGSRAGTSLHWTGELGEFLILDYAPSFAVASRIMDYLRKKWATR